MRQRGEALVQTQACTAAPSPVHTCPAVGLPYPLRHPVLCFPPHWVPADLGLFPTLLGFIPSSPLIPSWLGPCSFSVALLREQSICRMGFLLRDHLWEWIVGGHCQNGAHFQDGTMRPLYCIGRLKGGLAGSPPRSWRSPSGWRGS